MICSYFVFPEQDGGVSGEAEGGDEATEDEDENEKNMTKL